MDEFKQGKKHPETNAIIFKNVADYDRVRRILVARCKNCDQVISTDEERVKELVFECGDPKCYCKQSKYAPKVHRVCETCYDMWHALYFNSKLKNMNYFKELDEADKRQGGDQRRRMGLDDR